jgi:hypothetical protein
VIGNGGERCPGSKVVLGPAKGLLLGKEEAIRCKEEEEGRRDGHVHHLLQN